MNGVKLNEKHCERDFSFYLKDYIIGEPVPKLVTLPAPGSNKLLDFTRFFGKVLYEHRPLKLELKTVGTKEEQNARFSALLNAVNGQEIKAVLDDDPAFYYEGRATVGALTHGSDGLTAYTSVEVTSYPYKKRVKESVVTQSITTAPVSVTLHNDQEELVPDITATVPCEISFRGESHTIPAGPSILPSLQLAPGDNVVQVKAQSRAGGITFKWRGGSL